MDLSFRCVKELLLATVLCETGLFYGCFIQCVKVATVFQLKFKSLLPPMTFDSIALLFVLIEEKI